MGLGARSLETPFLLLRIDQIAVSVEDTVHHQLGRPVLGRRVDRCLGAEAQDAELGQQIEKLHRTSLPFLWGYYRSPVDVASCDIEASCAHNRRPSA